MIPVLGLDLSLTSTGVAVAPVMGDLTAWTVHTGTARGVPRLRIILNAIRDAVTIHRPSIVVIEELPPNPRQASAATIVALAKLHGIVEFWLDQRVPYVKVNQTLLKLYAAGRGNAPKDEVLLAAERRLSGYVASRITGNDEADALWLAAMVRDQYGAPLTPMPQAHRAALTKIVWPVLGRPDNPQSPPASGGRDPLPAGANPLRTTPIGR